jgi:serine/threonine protein kinase
VDYYALGVIIYEIMMGKRPYLGKSRQEIKQRIKEKQIIIPKRDIPDGWSI